MAPNSAVCASRFQYDENKLKTSMTSKVWLKTHSKWKHHFKQATRKRYFLLNIGWSTITLHISPLKFSIYIKSLFKTEQAITNMQSVPTSCKTMQQECLSYVAMQRGMSWTPYVSIREGPWSDLEGCSVLLLLNKKTRGNKHIKKISRIWRWSDSKLTCSVL